MKIKLLNLTGFPNLSGLSINEIRCITNTSSLICIRLINDLSKFVKKCIGFVKIFVENLEKYFTFNS